MKEEMAKNQNRVLNLMAGSPKWLLLAMILATYFAKSNVEHHSDTRAEDMTHHMVYKNSISESGFCDTTSLGKMAQSALERAKSEECKQKILNVACMGDDLYPKELKSTCDYYEKVKYLGCFQAFSNEGIFNHKMKYADYNSPYQCSKHCLQKNFTLTGVQNGDLCYCGNEIDQSLKVDGSNCDIPCSGESQQWCGGKSAMSVFEVSKYLSKSYQ